MKTCRGLRIWLLLGCLAAPGCASWYRPPVEKPPENYSLERMDEEHQARLEKELSLYSD
jgi:hypothetical protein